MSLSRASSTQSIPPHPTSWRSISILSSYLCLGLPCGLFLSGFPTKNLYTHHLFPVRATCSSHLIHLDIITWAILGEDYRSLSSSLCSLLHSPVTSSIPGPNLLGTLFSNTLSLRSSPSVSDQVSRPYTTTDKVIVLYILIFKFLDSKLGDKISCTEWWQAFPEFSLPLISSWPYAQCLPIFNNCYVIQVIYYFRVFLTDFCIFPFPLPCVLHALNVSTNLFGSSYNIGEEYKLWSSSLCNLLLPPVSSTVIHPGILSAYRTDQCFKARYRLRIVRRVNLI